MGIARRITLLRWWQKLRAARRAAIATDAEVLRVMHGDAAYYEARRRENAGAPEESNHWQAVALAIARRADRKVGLDTATRVAERED